MTAQNLSDLQRDALQWWIDIHPGKREGLSKKYIGTGDIKTLSHLEVMYCYLYFKEEKTH